MSLEHYTLVMIEDDEGHAALIKKNLKRGGIGNPIIHLEDGEQAIDYFFGENPPGPRDRLLVLLDLNLPKIDGFEVLRRLKGDEHTRAIPVIVLTTTDNPHEINRCYEMGCNVYITKPVAYESFSNAIQKLGMMVAVVKVPVGLAS